MTEERRRLWFETQKHLTSLGSALAVLFAGIVSWDTVRRSPRITIAFGLYLLVSLLTAVIGMWAVAHLEGDRKIFGIWAFVSMCMFLGALLAFVLYIGFIPVPFKPR